MVRAWAGSKSYGLKYRASGRQRIMTFGEHGALTAEDARKLAAGARAQVRQGKDPQAERDFSRARTAASSFAQFADLYEKRHMARKKARSADEDRRLLRLHLLPRFARRPLASITKVDVLTLKDDLADRPVAFNRARSLLHSMFERAIEWDLHPGPNPVARVDKHPERARERFLSAVEYAALFAALDAAEGDEHPSVIACIRLLALTGARLSEILTLEWANVDLEHGALRLPDSKTGAKVIPLGAPALQYLSSLPRLSRYVCYGANIDAPLAPPQRQWRRIRKAAKLPDLRLHDLRHGFASVAAVGGESLKLIGAALGHRQADTTDRYAHLQHDPVRALADRTAGRIAAFAAKGDAEIVQLPSRPRR
jgi:integrase